MSGPRKNVITLRISPEMHDALRKAAHRHCTSMNLLLAGACEALVSGAASSAQAVEPLGQAQGRKPTPGPGGPLCESVNPPMPPSLEICKVAG